MNSIRENDSHKKTIATVCVYFKLVFCEQNLLTWFDGRLKVETEQIPLPNYTQRGFCQSDRRKVCSVFVVVNLLTWHVSADSEILDFGLQFGNIVR